MSFGQAGLGASRRLLVGWMAGVGFKVNGTKSANYLCLVVSGPSPVGGFGFGPTGALLIESVRVPGKKHPAKLFSRVG